MVSEAKARKLSCMAAGAIATLSRQNVINQIMVAEEDGIPLLVELLDESFAMAQNVTSALWHLAAYEDNQSAIARAEVSLFGSASRQRRRPVRNIQLLRSSLFRAIIRESDCSCKGWCDRSSRQPAWV